MHKNTESISETDLASLLEGRLEPEKLRRAEALFAEDGQALAELMTARRVLDTTEAVQFPDVPMRSLEKARQACRTEKGLFDLVLGFGRDAMKVIQCMPEVSVLAPAPAFGLRTSQATVPSMITFTKKFLDVDFECDVEKTAGSSCVIKVVLRQPGVKDRFRGLRISLVADGRELASSLAPGGETFFEDVHPGDYTIVVSRGGMRIAETVIKFVE